MRFFLYFVMAVTTGVITFLLSSFLPGWLSFIIGVVLSFLFVPWIFSLFIGGSYAIALLNGTHKTHPRHFKSEE